MKTIVRGVVLFLLLSASVFALEAGPNDVYVRVVDVGAGLCCVVKMPGNRYIIYDAGNHDDKGHSAFRGIMDVIPLGKKIDLLVLSHNHSDHQAAVPLICAGYKVKRVIRGGWTSDAGTWERANLAIERETADDNCDDHNLAEGEFPLGETTKYGKVKVTMVYGASQPPEDWPLQRNEKRNAPSIVIRLEYKDKSILFCGDSVGRHKEDPADKCFAAEELMVDNTDAIPIDSDVVIAPHHGGDNGSSTRFIEAVSPKYVVFSAGSKNKHPTEAAAERYLNLPDPPEKILRTDRYDNEGSYEWPSEDPLPAGEEDPIGDADVDIVIRKNGDLEVEYRDEG